MSVLAVEHLAKSFGGVHAVRGVSFEVAAGELLALIGPNGAGKTTFVNMLTGRLPPSSGRVLLAGEDVTRLSPEARVKRGLGRTFQINTLFRSLSVLDNVALGIAERRGIGGRLWRAASAYREVRDEALELLASLSLTGDAHTRVLDLPYGKQRLVEILIALGLRPKVLLLDEPAAGVPSVESERILEVLDRLPSDIAILIIEHDMDVVFRFAKRITVLVQGEVLCEGSPAEIAADKRVHEVYLGERHHG
jgi:branched-chain amino acid transport system ATP-binding protein